VDSGSSTWQNNIKVHKSKDLLGCTDRQNVQTIFQGSHYDSSSVSVTVSCYLLFSRPIRHGRFQFQLRCTQRLRSADTSTLLVPPTRRTTLGDRSFPAAAARAWNTLPQQVQDAPSLPVFRRELKTVLFQSSFPAD